MTTTSLTGIVWSATFALLVACGKESTAPPPAVASVEVTPAAAGVVIGQTVQLTAKVKDAAGKELVDRPVTWTSSAPTQATVSPTGLVTGLALGDSVVIMATSEGKSAGATIAVVMDIAGEWNFTEQINLIIWLIGGNGTGVATYLPCSDTGSYQFSQSGGEIGGTKWHVGTCLGAPSPNGDGVGSWDNTTPPFSIANGHLSSTHIRFGVGSAGCHYDGDINLPMPLPGGVPPPPTLTGTYSCPDGTNGTWEADRGGAPVASVAMRWDARIVVGGAVQLTAVPRDAAGRVLGRTVTWSVDNPSVASASSSGLVTARAPGSAHITATTEGQSGSAALTTDLVNFRSVSAADLYTCAVTSSDAAYCWGSGGDGQLGAGFRPPAREPPAARETPLAVAGDRAFTVVSAGGLYHSCGLAATGDAYCWGNNSSGELGDGSTTSSLAPVLVTGGHQFANVTVGKWHSCALTTANEVYCWGNNELGQLGTGAGNSATPVLVGDGTLHFESVDAGLGHTCGLTTDHQAYCWGYNYYGQVGNGATATAVTRPTAVQGGHSFVAVGSGFAHSCALSADGTAYCWGVGSLVGDGSGVSRLAPAQVAGGPFATADGSLAVGGANTCALTPAGTAYCWGRNELGELGDGSIIDRPTPVSVSGGLTFAALSVGDFHSCGITAGAVAYCWGDNSEGQLGADATGSCAFEGGSLPCAPAPVRVIGQPGAAAAGSLRVERRMQPPAAQPSRLPPSSGLGLPLPAPSLRLPRQ